MPKLEISPQKIMAGQGQNATFDCIAYGTDIKGMLWSRYGITYKPSLMVNTKFIYGTFIQSKDC